MDFGERIDSAVHRATCIVLLWMFKKRQARDTSTDNSTPKNEMESNPCYEITVVKQSTDTHLYEAVRGQGTSE